MKTFYTPGNWDAICDVCGFKFKASELKERWDGMRVCGPDYELRNPQDFIKVPKDDPSVPWSRPEAADTFTSVVFRSIDATTKDVI